MTEALSSRRPDEDIAAVQRATDELVDRLGSDDRAGAVEFPVARSTDAPRAVER